MRNDQQCILLTSPEILLTLLLITSSSSSLSPSISLMTDLNVGSEVMLNFFEKSFVVPFGFLYTFNCFDYVQILLLG